MGQVLHRCATTTEEVRRAIQNSQENLRALASRYGINQKTVRKWRGRSSTADLRTGPKPLDRRCRENGIEHRCMKINHPWSNGQVEQMNRTIKEATVQPDHYEDHSQLRRHLANCPFSWSPPDQAKCLGRLDAYNYARRLKTQGLTPHEFICKQRTTDPKRFSEGSQANQTPAQVKSADFIV